MREFSNWFGYVIGVLAGLQQLTIWFKSRRLRKAQERAFEILNYQLNATAAREEAERYDARRHELRHQIEQEIPREARRVYLLNRQASLSESVSRDYEELQQVTNELASKAPASPLDEQIRRVIEESIVPDRLRRQRRDRLLFGLIGLLLLFNFLPVGDVFLLPLDVLVRPQDHGYIAFATALVFLLLTVCGSTLFAIRNFSLYAWPRTRNGAGALLFAFLLAATYGLAGVIFTWRQRHQQDAYTLGQNRGLFYETYGIWIIIAWIIIGGTIMAVVGHRVNTHWSRQRRKWWIPNPRPEAGGLIKNTTTSNGSHDSTMQFDRESHDS